MSDLKSAKDDAAIAHEAMIRDGAIEFLDEEFRRIMYGVNISALSREEAINKLRELWSVVQVALTELRDTTRQSKEQESKWMKEMLAERTRHITDG